MGLQPIIFGFAIRAIQPLGHSASGLHRKWLWPVVVNHPQPRIMGT